jgi:DNA (cytosine-5)-methyltransferase 1
MRHGSLFSGIGGFDLAAEWMGWENVFHCEWNPFGQKVLKHHFPNSISYNDITKTDFSIHRGNIDIITGGFPCQPYSTAGLRKGKADERHLFPEMLRAIKEIQPTWVIGENVRGLVSWGGGMVFHEVCDDLEREGYEVQPFIIPAASVNAPHKRERIWFVAYSKINDAIRIREYKNNKSENNKTIRTKSWNKSCSNGANGVIANTNTTRCENRDKQYRGESAQSKQGECGISGHSFGSESNTATIGEKENRWKNFPTKSPICGGDDGLPRELDNITFSKWRNESIKAYGNAIVPQVAYEIFKAIGQMNNIIINQENN